MRQNIECGPVPDQFTCNVLGTFEGVSSWLIAHLTGTDAEQTLIELMRRPCEDTESMKQLILGICANLVIAVETGKNGLLEQTDEHDRNEGEV